MTILLLTTALLFAIGAKATLKNELGQINWLLQIGVPKWAIVALVFIASPVVVWNGVMWLRWKVRVWWALMEVKRAMRYVLRKLSKANKDNPELQKDLQEMRDLISKM